jgi:hypothetical protein
MPGELVTAATVLAGSGAGTWLADKLLGPTAEGFGEQLRIYLGGRWNKVFSRASEKANPEDVHALPPGFTYQIVQKASFSEDDETLTEMWANLLLDAAKDYRGRHSLFVDILSQLGPSDVRVLGSIVPPDYDFAPGYIAPLNLRDSIRVQVESSTRGYASSGDAAVSEINRILLTQFGWPGALTFASMPWRNPDSCTTSWAVGGSSIQIEHEVLIRQQLIERFSIAFKHVMPAPSVEGILATSLGLEFVAVCRGSNL